MPFGTDTLTEGGLPFSEGGLGRILYARWSAEAPEGYQAKTNPLFFRVAIQPLNADFEDDGNIVIENNSAGSLDDFVPVDSEGEEVGYGTDIAPVGTKQGISKSSKFGIFLQHLIESGVPEDDPGVTEDCSELDGCVFTWGRIPEPKGWSDLRKSRARPKRRRRGEEPEEEDNRVRTILVPVEWDEDNSDPDLARDPEEVDEEYEEQTKARREEREEESGSRRGPSAKKRAAKKGGKRVAKKGGRKAGASSGSRKKTTKKKSVKKGSKKKKTRRSEEPEDEGGEEDAASETAKETLAQIIEEDGSILKKKLRVRAHNLLKGEGELGPAEIKGVLSAIMDDENLEGWQEDVGFEFDGEELTS